MSEANHYHYIALSDRCRRILTDSLGYSGKSQAQRRELGALYSEWSKKLESGAINIGTHQCGLLVIQTAIALVEDPGPIVTVMTPETS
jgi:hypothetical protein